MNPAPKFDMMDGKVRVAIKGVVLLVEDDITKAAVEKMLADNPVARSVFDEMMKVCSGAKPEDAP